MRRRARPRRASCCASSRTRPERRSSAADADRAVEGRFLQTLVFATGARRVLEIGTYSGYSAISMAAGLPEDGRIDTCELEPRHAEVARRYIERAGLSDRITVHLGPAGETIERLDGPFDLVFVDADKTGYAAYYEAVLPKLAPRGLIVFDNMLQNGRVVTEPDAGESTRAIAELNDRLRDDPRVTCVLLTVRDGVAPRSPQRLTSRRTRSRSSSVVRVGDADGGRLAQRARAVGRSTCRSRSCANARPGRPARREDHPRHGDVEGGIAGARVRPVDHDRPRRRAARSPGAGRGAAGAPLEWDLVQPRAAPPASPRAVRFATVDAADRRPSSGR